MRVYGKITTSTSLTTIAILAAAALFGVLIIKAVTIAYNKLKQHLKPTDVTNIALEPSRQTEIATIKSKSRSKE